MSYIEQYHIKAAPSIVCSIPDIGTHNGVYVEIRIFKRRHLGPDLRNPRRGQTQSRQGERERKGIIRYYSVQVGMHRNMEFEEKTKSDHSDR